MAGIASMEVPVRDLPGARKRLLSDHLAIVEGSKLDFGRSSPLATALLKSVSESAPHAVLKLVPRHENGELGKPELYVQADVAKAFHAFGGAELGVLRELAARPRDAQGLADLLKAHGFRVARGKASVSEFVYRINERADRMVGWKEMVYHEEAGVAVPLYAIPYRIAVKLGFQTPASVVPFFSGNYAAMHSFVVGKTNAYTEEIAEHLGFCKGTSSKPASRAYHMLRIANEASSRMTGKPLFSFSRAERKGPHLRLLVSVSQDGEPSFGPTVRLAFSATRSKILESIDARPGMDVGAKAKALGMTPYVLRRHLGRINRSRFNGISGPHVVMGRTLGGTGTGLFLSQYFAKAIGSSSVADRVVMSAQELANEFVRIRAAKGSFSEMADFVLDAVAGGRLDLVEIGTLVRSRSFRRMLAKRVSGSGDLTRLQEQAKAAIDMASTESKRKPMAVRQ